jgi:uncharacterized phage protein (TIGR02218 family)
VDGVVFRFTSHDTTIQYDGVDYVPAGGFNSSARQRVDGLKDRNFESSGMITSDDITFDDLRAGLFRQAMVEIMLIDWMYPWAEPYETNKFWIAGLNFTGEVWMAQLEGITHKLKQNVGRVAGRKCDVHEFGDSRCNVPGGVAAWTETASVVAVSATKPRRGFTTNFATSTNDWFKGGTLTWTSGANTGLKMGINTNVGQGVTLWIDMPYDIEEGDSFTAVVGCDRTAGTCFSKFDNIINFRGYPTVPGTDAMLTTPDAKL